MRHALVVTALLFGCATAPAPAPVVPTDLTAVRALFERNIQAIRDKDRDAYLACYRADDRLVRAGKEGVKLGFEPLAAQTSSVASTWPTALEATDMVVHPIAPGVAYGAYRYRVTIAGVTTEGLSERVFVRGDEGWRIAVTTAFED